MIENSNKLARITVDLPVNMQKKLKTFAAVHNKSMREVVIDSLNQTLKTLDAEIIKCFSAKND
jgi:plasmid stability protein